MGCGSWIPPEVSLPSMLISSCLSRLHSVWKCLHWRATFLRLALNAQCSALVNIHELLPRMTDCRSQQISNILGPIWNNLRKTYPTTTRVSKETQSESDLGPHLQYYALDSSQRVAYTWNKKVFTHTNIVIYNTVHTHILCWFSFIDHSQFELWCTFCELHVMPTVSQWNAPNQYMYIFTLTACRWSGNDDRKCREKGVDKEFSHGL